MKNNKSEWSRRLTEKQIDYIIEKSAKATPGGNKITGGGDSFTLLSNGVRVRGQSFGNEWQDHDAEFFAATNREDIRALCLMVLEARDFLEATALGMFTTNSIKNGALRLLRRWNKSQG